MEKQTKSVSITNRKAWHDYTIDETFEVGIVLVGTEVKSVRAGQVTLLDSYCRVDGGELWVHQMYIAPYAFTNRDVPEPRRPRKLLLHKEEIARLQSRAEQKGLTIIPLKIYFTRGHAKMEIGIGRGKKQYDKRQTIADRDVERDLRREMSNRE
jgi:SsrA-binding protein